MVGGVDWRVFEGVRNKVKKGLGEMWNGVVKGVVKVSGWVVYVME